MVRHVLYLMAPIIHTYINIEAYAIQTIHISTLILRPVMFSDIFYAVLFYFHLKLNSGYNLLYWFCNLLTGQIHSLENATTIVSTRYHESNNEKHLTHMGVKNGFLRGLHMPWEIETVYWEQSLVHFLWYTEKQIPKRTCNETECERVIEWIKE